MTPLRQIGLTARHEVAEQTVCFMVDAGREEERVGAGARGGGCEAQSPQPGDLDRSAARARELTEVLAGQRVVRVDSPVAEVADQDVAAEDAERGRRERDRPGRVELA